MQNRPRTQESLRRHLTAQQLAAAIYAAETAKLLKDINALLQKMSQNVSTIDYMIRLDPTSRVLSEIKTKMEESAELLDQLLPLTQRLLATPEPRNSAANVYWWIERERINNELDRILKKFRTMHEYLTTGRMTATPIKTLERILSYEMKLSKQIQEVCQKSLFVVNGAAVDQNKNDAIEVIQEEEVSPMRSRSMEPDEFRRCVSNMKRSTTRSSVRSCSPRRRMRKGRRGACITS